MSRGVTVVALCIAFATGAWAEPPLVRPPNLATAVRATPKPAGPIGVSYRLSREPEVGVALDVTITVAAPGAVELSFEARVADPDALLVGTPVARAAGEGRSEFVVTVVPLAPRQSFLDVLVSARLEGTPQSRSVVVPIRPAAAQPDGLPSPSAVSDEGGERLISLPVEER